MMKRREFITLLGGTAAWPLAARAQQSPTLRRIGVLMSTAAGDAEGRARIAAFLDELQKLGWIDGRSARIDTRWPTSMQEVRKYSAELVGLAPDVLLATGSASLADFLGVTRAAVLRDSAIAACPVRRHPGCGAFPRRGVARGRCARYRRDRARHHSLRARFEQRPDRDREPGSDISSRSRYRACRSAPLAGGLPGPRFRRRRRSDLLWG